MVVKGKVWCPVPFGLGDDVIAPVGLVAFDLCFFMDGVIFYWWHEVYSQWWKGLQCVDKC